MSTTYTKEEQNKILSTMQYMVEDMFKIYDQTNTKQLAVRLDKCLGISDVSELVIAKTSIKLITYVETFIDDYLGDYFFGGYKKDKTYILGTRTFSKPKANKIDFDTLSDFIKHYDEIRDYLYDESKEKLSKKESSTKGVDQWYDRFKRETTVEFELPATNNQYQVEVTSENGKTIGTFYFGDKTINIITNGEMNFIDKRTGEKVKTK